MARITCIGQAGIGLGERRAVLGLDRTVELLEGLFRDRGDHVREGDVVFSRERLAESLECGAEISKLVRRNFPVAFLLRPPEPLVPGLDRPAHEAADSWEGFGTGRSN